MKTVHKPILLIAVGAGFLLGACDNDKFPEKEIVVKDNVSFALDIQPILTSECATCHNPSEAEPDLRVGVAYQSLMGLPSGSIVPGNAEQSELTEMLEWAQGSDNPMPPAGPMSPLKIALIKKWIDEGALNN